MGRKICDAGTIPHRRQNCQAFKPIKSLAPPNMLFFLQLTFPMKSKLKSQSTRSNPGIKAIAEALGISIATVDRVLHQRDRISEKTRTRVLSMAAQLDYKPN